MTHKEKEQQEKVETTTKEHFEIFMKEMFDDDYEFFMTVNEVDLWFKNYKELN